MRMSRAKSSEHYMAITQLRRVIFPVLPLTSTVSLGESKNLSSRRFPFYEKGIIIVTLF